MSVQPKIELEAMQLEDLDEVMDIEERCFPNPWPRRIFEMETLSPRALNLVARINGVLGGYIISWFIYDEIHILNIAVDPEFRNMGVGKTLMRTCLDHFIERGAKHAILEVRTSNTPAQKMYEKFGFSRIGVRKHYYSDNGEDAIIMMLTLC